ncbi:MAG: DNA cytosine methyltransferase, partial [Chloroherpetonaceae bacterium]|nr:DNA cytosine methyltransferase [Chloroherpetonaceae bacterium]
ELRSFFRQFAPGQVPEDYYEYLRGRISRDTLFARHPGQAAAARNEARQAELGSDDDRQIFHWIQTALDGVDRWVLIGGPPCQLYSLAGRSRLARLDRSTFESDRRHTLYREYLRIIARFSPQVFVMENVTGILSSLYRGENIFLRILDDLRCPEGGNRAYRIYSLTTRRIADECYVPGDYVVRCERYGIPQKRHRVILIGVREDLTGTPAMLSPGEQIPVEQVIGDLPPLRSQLSRESDSPACWRGALRSAALADWYRDPAILPLRQVMEEAMCAAAHLQEIGGAFVPCHPAPERFREWYVDDRLGGVCNHETRAHMRSDLLRYLFAASFARVHGRSPLLHEFPQALHPAHRNLPDAITGRGFNDRFRVQVAGSPATTITAHISRDGHYYIHPDPAQCRSLTVREAARIQTFPDNYFFEGPRTEQYRQVGNAVPPLLARQIAGIVHDLIA